MARALVVLVLTLLGGCKKEPEVGPPAEIIDLSSGVAPLHAAFDARRGEARFLTLLSPT